MIGSVKMVDHNEIIEIQRQLVLKYYNSSPSLVTEIYWIYAFPKQKNYKKPKDNSGGKWLIFVPNEKIDDTWHIIKIATENGILGCGSKVATAKENPNATNSKTKVICVYSYDADDEKDVLRIREELRKLGFENKLSYKTDKATLEGKYSNRGNKKISKYYL